MNQSERTERDMETEKVEENNQIERDMETEKAEENNPIHSQRSVNHSQSTHWQIHALLWR